MLDTQVIIMILCSHFLGDFVLQSDRMALNKSKSFLVLLTHTFAYSLPFISINHLYAGINAFTHAGVDAITSRITSKLWKDNRRYWFFVMIGFDQLIHLCLLFWTYPYLVK